MREDGWMHWYRVRPLDGRIDGPSAGVRSVEESDLDLLVTLRQGRGIPLPSYRLLRARSVIYRADLDLVSVASDGSITAFATVWYDEPNRTGLFEPVGCHPDHRRRGMASRVMREGLRRLRESGARQALVPCSGANAPANALCESLGFHAGGRSTTWCKTV